MDGWLSVVAGVQLLSETEITTSSSIPLYIIVIIVKLLSMAAYSVLYYIIWRGKCK